MSLFHDDTKYNIGGPMKTECTAKYDRFQALGKREIVAEFNGGMITSDRGSLLLREVEQRY
jgi:hypothetical protein